MEIPIFMISLTLTPLGLFLLGGEYVISKGIEKEVQELKDKELIAVVEDLLVRMKPESIKIWTMVLLMSVVFSFLVQNMQEGVLKKFFTVFLLSLYISFFAMMFYRIWKRFHQPP